MQGAGKVLAGQQLGVVSDRKYLTFRVEMVSRRHLVAACGQAERRILDALQALKRRVLDITSPYRSSIIDLRSDKGLVGDKHGVGVLAPGSAGKSFQDLESLSSSLRNLTGVRREGVLVLSRLSRRQWRKGRNPDPNGEVVLSYG